MNFRPPLLKPAGPAALAQESDFSLGSLSVSPSRLEVCAGAKREIIQPRVMQVLTLLAGRRGEVVSRDDLLAICWGSRVIGEDAINRSIASVRRLGESSGEFSIETVRRVGYRLEQLASAKVAAVETPPAPSAVVLAVLAFDNHSEEADMAYFSDGVSEEILQAVSRDRDLVVIGRSSSFRFRGPEKAAAHVGKELNATHILDGSIRRSGCKIRISVSLTECARETAIWSDSFERELADFFGLQDEIATAVAAMLKGVLSPSSHDDSAAAASQRSAMPPRQRSDRAQIDPAGYLAYLQGRFHLNKRNRTDMYRAVEYFKGALAIAPDHTDARANLALAYALLAANGQSPESLWLANRETALALDRAPDNLAALTASALVATSAWRWSDAYEIHKRLEARYGNISDAHHFYGTFLEALQLPELCLQEFRVAAELDPLSALDRGNVGEALHMLGREEEAIFEFSRSLTLDPNMAFSLSGLCVSYANAGRLEEAKSLMSGRLSASDGADGFYTIRCKAIIAYCETGSGTAMIELARDAEEKYKGGSVNPALVGLIYALAGEFDAAIDWFQKSVDEHDLRFFQNTAEPLMPMSLKSSPRWVSFMQQPALSEWAGVRREVAEFGRRAE